jgi:RNA polymerase sigma factor (sigma-70 family)
VSDQALSRLVRTHHGELVSHVRGSLRSANDAEDIVQETWIRADRVLGAQARGGPVVGNIRALLFRIAGNLSIDHLRKRRVRAHLEAESLDAPAARNAAAGEPLAEARLLQREQEAAFAAVLRRLPTRARRVLILSRVEGWTYPRIAEHLGVSLRTVSNDMETALRGCLLMLTAADD